MLKAIRFRVQNYKNIDDSGWIPLENVTAFVGRNESGKTALLKALHKFNPANPEPYNPQRDFPRDRFTSEYKPGSNWPVCSVEFRITNQLLEDIKKICEGTALDGVICTRYYSGELNIDLDLIEDLPIIEPDTITNELRQFKDQAMRIPTGAEEEEGAIQYIRTDLSSWADKWESKLEALNDLRAPEGISLLSTMREEANSKGQPKTADIVQNLQMAINQVLKEANKVSCIEQIKPLIRKHLPVFIYFDDYGILDSAIHLPSFLESLATDPISPRVRTVNAMFKHVGLVANDIHDLGKEQAETLASQHQPIDVATIESDQQRKEARAIKLNSASLDITTKFNGWYGQRRHSIDYQADGNYFRIWIADDKRPGVRIELEGRSKGFQWFFSFYLIFLVESEEGHKNAILLLDEPGLHLHPTAQQELISFFEKLAEKNQLIYTTHSPFLIDGENLHRVRPVTEDETGHSHVDIEGWPRDRETIFPLQAAAGYAMVRGLFQKKKNILVEGISDYYYLHALSQQCSSTNRPALPDDIYVTPCGGTKLVGNIASLFLGQEVRPLVLLDGDDAGRIRRKALLKELYAAHDSAVLVLDEVLGRPGEVEIEDIVGEEQIVPALNSLIGQEILINRLEGESKSLPDLIKSAAGRQAITLPDGWKATIASRLVYQWAEEGRVLPDDVLDAAALLFNAINERMNEGITL